MSNAVYILSSLPMLRFGDVPPFSVATFRHRCAGVLTEEELDAFDALLEGRESEDPFVSAYQARETQMKNVAGRLRASAWGPDVRFSERMYKGYDVAFAKKVSDAFAKPNPLEKEEEIDRARFALVDELAPVGEPTVEHVYAFAVKLAICERWARLSDEAGNAEVLKVINENDPAHGQE